MSDEIKNRLILEAKRIEEDALYSSKGHYNAGESWKYVHYWIGIPTVILAALASASAFGKESLIAGVIGIIVTSLTALSTFLDPSGKQNTHKAAGAAFGTLKNQARLFYELDVNLENDLAKLRESLNALALKRDDLNTTCPSIPEKAYLKARNEIEKGNAMYKVDKEYRK